MLVAFCITIVRLPSAMQTSTEIQFGFIDGFEPGERCTHPKCMEECELFGNIVRDGMAVPCGLGVQKLNRDKPKGKPESESEPSPLAWYTQKSQSDDEVPDKVTEDAARADDAINDCGSNVGGDDSCWSGEMHDFDFAEVKTSEILGQRPYFRFKLTISRQYQDPHLI